MRAKLLDNALDAKSEVVAMLKYGCCCIWRISLTTSLLSMMHRLCAPGQQQAHQGALPVARYMFRKTTDTPLLV
jgi:hypothetical protein